MKTTADLYHFFLDHPVISTDSRNVPENAIFFGLKGEVADGNRFAAQALAKGASLAVVDDPSAALDARYMLVPDGLATLQELAAMHRSNLQARIIAITGSNGKTTTKELIHRVVSTVYRTVSTAGNLNNHIGVPLTLLSLRRDTELAVVEIGANHPGEIAGLCRIARPDTGIVTNIGRAHLEGFGGFEGVIRAKSELYDHLRKNGGTAWINGDDPLLIKQSEGITRTIYGMKDGADCQGLIIDTLPALSLKWRSDEGWLLLKTNLYGEYNFYNILAAICVGTSLGVPTKKINAAIEGYTPENNRSQLLATPSNQLILDAYNANPTSMRAALENFSRIKDRSKMAILGDMLELGDESESEHALILALLDGLEIGQVVLVGPMFARANSAGRFPSFADVSAAAAWLENYPVKGCSVLLKGSRRIGLEKLIEVL